MVLSTSLLAKLFFSLHELLVDSNPFPATKLNVCMMFGFKVYIHVSMLCTPYNTDKTKYICTNTAKHNINQVVVST